MASRDRGPSSGEGFLIPTAIIVAVIIYGSLYPFGFRQPHGGVGPVRHLLRSWAEAPGRGDFIANIFFYLPLGFFGSLAAAASTRVLPRLLLVTVAGGLLSTSMELAQYYIPWRVSAADDVYANIIGTALGAVVGVVAGGNFRWLPFREVAADRAAFVLLALWIGYRLYPYVPTIDLHKYWEALKPVVFHPRPTGYDLFRYIAIWLAIGGLIEGLSGARAAKLAFPLFVAAVLAGKVLIIGKTLSAAEIVGAVIALPLWFLLAVVGTRFRFAALALLFCSYVVSERLEPFQFGAHARSFGWVPFRSLIYGSPEVNILSFLEKAFLYGSLIWLFGRSGLEIRVSTVLVAIMLFATSWAETYLPGRSAEVTDALIGLLIGAVIMALARTNSHAPPVRR